MMKKENEKARLDEYSADKEVDEERMNGFKKEARKQKENEFCRKGHFFDADDGCRGCGRSIGDVLNARRDDQ